MGSVPLDAKDDDELDTPGRRADDANSDATSANTITQKQVAGILEQYFSEGELVSAALEYVSFIEHIIDFTMTRALNTENSLLNKTTRNILEYNVQHSDFPLPLEPLEQYIDTLVMPLSAKHTQETPLQAQVGRSWF